MAIKKKRLIYTVEKVNTLLKKIDNGEVLTPEEKEGLLNFDFSNMDIDLNGYAKITYVDSAIANLEVFEGVTVGMLNDNGVSVKTHGAKGDNETDDTEAIRTAINYCANIAKDTGYRPTLYFPPSNGYVVKSTIEIPPSINVIMDGMIIYDGSGACMVIGEEDLANNGVEMKLNVMKKTRSDWTDMSVVGIRLINATTCDIDIIEATNFTVGVECIGIGKGFAYNTIRLGRLRDNYLAMDFTNETSTTNQKGWCNENYILGGRICTLTTTNKDKNRYGIRITSKDGTYVNNNGNLFEKISFELCPNEDIVDNLDVVPVLIEYGRMNKFVECRHEDNSPTFARLSNEASDNFFSVLYGQVNEIEDNSNYPTSVFKTRRDDVIDECNKLVFKIDDLVGKCCLYDDDEHNFQNLFCVQSSDGRIRARHTKFTMDGEYISIPSTRGLGVRLDTSKVKTLLLKKDVDVASPGKVAVRCYNANGDIIGSSSEDLARGRIQNKIEYNNIFGGVYTNVTDSKTSFYCKLADEVAFVDMLVIGGSKPCKLRGLSIWTLEDGHVPILNPLKLEDNKNYAVMMPSSGTWSVGKIVYNIEPVSGQYIGWIYGTDEKWHGFGKIE